MNQNKVMIIVGAAIFTVLSVGLGGAQAANADAPAPSEPYTIVALQMPSYADATTPTWPQHFEQALPIATADLSALDSLLQCGIPHQVDIHGSGTVVDALIAGGYLNGPNDPQENLIPGGWGIAYKLVPATDCSEKVCSAEYEQTTTSYRYDVVTDRTTHVATSTRVDTGSTTTTLSDADAFAAGCFTPPLPPTPPPSCVDTNTCLAHTGLNDFLDGLLLGISGSAVLAGIGLLIPFGRIWRRNHQNRTTAKHRKEDTK